MRHAAAIITPIRMSLVIRRSLPCVRGGVLPITQAPSAAIGGARKARIPPPHAIGKDGATCCSARSAHDDEVDACSGALEMLNPRTDPPKLGLDALRLLFSVRRQRL